MDITTLFQNVVTGANLNLQLMPEFANNYWDNCYNGYVPGAKGSVGAEYSTTINLPVVDENNVTNIGNGPISLSPINTVPVSIITDQKLSTSRPIQTFDQARTPILMRDQFLRPMAEEVMRKGNRYLANLARDGFNVNPTIKGPSSANPAFSRLNLSRAWQTLMDQGCPGTNLRCFVQTTPYANMIGDETNKFIQQYIVGTDAATSLQQSAKMMPQFGAMLDYDQHCSARPVAPATTSPAGIYGGTFYHKMALAIAPFVEEAVEGSFVKQTIFYPTKGKSIPFTAQLWHDPTNQKVVLHVFVCLGAKVVKPEWGQYLETVPAAAQSTTPTSS